MIIAVHDADTVTADIDLGFGVWRRHEHLRLRGLDAPELNTPEGKTARDWLAARLPENTAVIVQTVKDRSDKYGRMLADVWLPGGHSINDELIASGNARPWSGLGPRPWSMPKPWPTA